MPDPVSERHVAAVEFVRDACRFAHEAFLRQEFRVDFKDDASPVTKVDRRAERLLRDAIEAEFPGDRILGEEFGESGPAGGHADTGYQWVLDPIDGTRPFIHGVAAWGTLAGVLRAGHGGPPQPVVGVCGLPVGGRVELYHGKHVETPDAGRPYVGGVFGDQMAAARSLPPDRPRADSLSEATVLYTQLDLFDTPPLRALLDALVAKCRLVRGWGDCFGHMAVADGRADLMIDPKMNLWDAAALLPIVEASGAQFRTLGGECRVDGGSAVSVSPAVAEEFFSLVTRVGLVVNAATTEPV